MLSTATIFQAERKLGTGGLNEDYHQILRRPLELQADGIVIGIEKVCRSRLGLSHYGPDTRKFNSDSIQNSKFSKSDKAAQSRFASLRMSDPKIPTVTHTFGRLNGDTLTEPVFSLYSNNYSGTESFYARSWNHLESLGKFIDAQLDQSETIYTHVLVFCMGWNTDQKKSIANVNELLCHTRVEFLNNKQEFRPFAIVFTWPSTWGSTLFWPFRLLTHIASYANKANDADEIGMTIVNHLINKTLPNISKLKQLPLVCIGHSFGARVLSRALHSSYLLTLPLKTVREAKKQQRILIGLQPAFSALRFRANYQLFWLFKWLFACLWFQFSPEGGPYQKAAGGPVHMAFTWSRHDLACPIASMLSGATHMGGRLGYWRTKSQTQMFRHLLPSGLWEPSAVENKIYHIDASSIVASHGGILNAKVGRLIFNIIHHFNQ